MAINLTTEQRHIAILEEAEHQLTTMKQYLTDNEKHMFLALVEKYGSLWQQEEIMSKYEKAWG